MESPETDRTGEGQTAGLPSRRWPGRIWTALHRNRRAAAFWIILLLFILIGFRLHLNKPFMAVVAILWGLGTQIFIAAVNFLLPYIGSLPFLGPVLVKLITVPLFILINAVAFLASLVGLKLGHKRTVFESRIAATILMIGIMIGYILGKIF